METEYFWWDLDKSRFKGVLYDSIVTAHPILVAA